MKTSEDLILSRIFRLRGLEDGPNRCGKVDTWNRMIYIRGTNHENQLGRPASHGCIRLSSRDVMDLFRYVRAGKRVLISDW
jgi:L,D-transpeptidase YbiS